MARNNSRSVFGELELAVLESVKTHAPVTVKEVKETIGGKDSYATIMAILDRLAEKGELQRERKGRHHLYRLGKSKD